jgi:spore maturation protein CgeB
MSQTFPKTQARFLVLDGIGGVPLGREITESLQATGHAAIHIDCLRQSSRALYGIRSACAKVINRGGRGAEFYHLPRLKPQTLRDFFAAASPSHVLVIGFIYKFLDPKALRKMCDEHGAALFLYDTDSCNLYGKRREFIFFIERELPIYDTVFSFSQVTTRFFRGTRNLPAIHLPFAAPIPRVTPQATEKTLEALFVGSGDLRRIFLLEHIREQVTVFGNRWQRHDPLISRALAARITDRPVWGDELRQLLARAKIVLNITRSDFYGAETGVNLRIFEAVAAGCFLLTDHCDELEDLFWPGREIETFHSAQDLADKACFYLEHETERLAIARRGHERFLASHTWSKRIGQMLAHMNSISGATFDPRSTHLSTSFDMESGQA